MYEVIETPCFPCKYKVINRKYRTDNAHYLYFRTEKEAQEYANKLNRKWGVVMNRENEQKQGVVIGPHELKNDPYCIQEVKRLAKLHLAAYPNGSKIGDIERTVSRNWGVMVQ